MEFKIETWEYLEELEEIEKIINELGRYEHVKVGYSEEITSEDLRTYQGYYSEWLKKRSAHVLFSYVLILTSDTKNKTIKKELVKWLLS